MANLADVPIMGKKFWQVVGDKIRGWVKADLDQGIFQYGVDKQPYRSRQYVRYKANRMERFTTRGGTKGTKLKALRGRAISSTETSFVNMQLTGETIRGLKGKNATETGVTMSFPPASTMKIIGNERYGRGIVGLNEKNQDMIKDMILKESGRKISAATRKKIIIHIG